MSMTYWPVSSRHSSLFFDPVAPAPGSGVATGLGTGVDAGGKLGMGDFADAYNLRKPKPRPRPMPKIKTRIPSPTTPRPKRKERRLAAEGRDGSGIVELAFACLKEIFRRGPQGRLLNCVKSKPPFS